MWREANLPQGREGWVRSPSYSSHLYAAVCTASWNPPTEERGATARRGRGLSPAQTAFLCLQHGPPGGLGTVSVCCAHSAPLSPVLSPPPGHDVELPGASPVLTVLVWAFWVRSPGPLVVPYLPASSRGLHIQTCAAWVNNHSRFREALGSFCALKGAPLGWHDCQPQVGYISP